ncbi:hypothetical protein ZWY2020_031327 [Hordeum vulgare]|nr:hypothetical protein ZWY2020_031327 [Hordeum vulgare]
MVTASKGPPLRITHPSHPGHVLTLYATGGALFQCDGCRHYGEDDRRYRCDPCDYDLHVCCVPLKMEDLTLTHPFFKGCTFDFRYSPPSTVGHGSFCGACGDQVLGFMFHDGERKINLHTQCANLAERVVQEDGVFDLVREAPAGGSCVMCRQGQGGRRGRFWCYGYLDGHRQPAYTHVGCMMEACYKRSQIAQVSAPTAWALGTPATWEVGTTQGTPTTWEVGTPQSTPTTWDSGLSSTISKVSLFCKVAVAVARVASAVSTATGGDPLWIDTTTTAADPAE